MAFFNKTECNWNLFLYSLQQKKRKTWILTIRCELTGRRLFTEELEQPPILVVKSHKPTTQLCRTHTGTSPQFLENLISTIRIVAALHQQFLVDLLLFLFIGRHRAPVRAGPLDKHGDSFWQTDQNFYCPLIHSCPYLSKTTNRRLWPVRHLYLVAFYVCTPSLVLEIFKDDLINRALSCFATCW